MNMCKKMRVIMTEIEAIRERHSVRQYQDKKIDKGIVKYHFEVGAEAAK